MSLQVHEGVRAAPSIPEHGCRIIEVDGQWGVPESVYTFQPEQSGESSCFCPDWLSR